MSPTFAALSIRNYRIWAVGGFISNVGTWMGRVAQDWLVLTELSDHSALALGTVTGLQFAGFLVLAPWAGMIADRCPKRGVLMTTQAVMAATAALLGLLAISGLAQLWMVYLIAAVSGIAAAIDAPARQTFVGEMVPPDSLSNAVSLNSASFNAGRLVGPGIAGLLIAATSTGVALLINSASFVAVLIALTQMRTSELNPSPQTPTGPGGVRQGWDVVRARTDLRLIMMLVFVLGTFGLNFQITTALMATVVFHKGPQEYGILGSILAIGSLSAALLAARRRRPSLQVLGWALVGFTIASTLAALAPTYTLFALSLIPVGMSSLTALTTANVMIQTRVDPSVRGRVMALYLALLMGGTPIGSPLIGWVGHTFGPRWTILAGAVAVGASLVIAAIMAVRSGEFSRQEILSTMRPTIPRQRRKSAYLTSSNT